jgi:hypothetical protein
MALSPFQARKRQFVLIVQDYARALLQLRLRPYTASLDFLATEVPAVGQPLAWAKNYRFFTPSAAVARAKCSAAASRTVTTPSTGYAIERPDAKKQWLIPAELRARLGHRSVA